MLIAHTAFPQECVSCQGNTVNVIGVSSAIGVNNYSNGQRSFASGEKNTVKGNYSLALGFGNIANGESAVAGGKTCSASGKGSIALGESAQALGRASFATGFGVKAKSPTTFAIGSNLDIWGENSIGLGHFLKTTVSGAFVIGSGAGTGANYLMNTTPNSLMVGFSSSMPTLFVGDSPDSDRTGRIGIGNVTSPQAKLHILGDDYAESDDASLFIQSAGSHYSTIWLGDKDHGIKGKPGSDLTFTTSTGTDFVFDGGDVGIGTTSPTRTLDVDGSLRIRAVARFDGNVGIGTGSPDYKLEVNGDFSVGQVSHLNGISLFDDADITGADRIVGFNDLRLSGDENGGTDIMVLANGNVGISTTTPNEKLEVDGNILQTTGHSLSTSQIKAPDATGLSLTDQSGNGIFVDDGGNVGIGTDPEAKLHVNGDLKLLSENMTSQFQILGNGQVPDRRGISLTNDPDGAFDFYIHGWQTNAAFNFKNGLDQSTLMTINKNGQIGIGTTNLQPGYILTVDGKVLAEEVKIQNSDSWYDFVFDEGYNLPSLADLDDYVKQNKHLPDVPSAKEVAENGYSLGEMNGILLKKVEELTLYVIEQQKTMELQQKMLEKQQKQIEKILGNGK